MLGGISPRAGAGRSGDRQLEIVCRGSHGVSPPAGNGHSPCHRRTADETPGAREAHCVYFIDRALSTFDRKRQPAYTQGLQDLQAKTEQLYPGAGKFSALTSEQQIKTLTAMEKTPFFNTVRTHTVIGFLARPVHGGNQDKIGWKLIGYDDSLNHKPPFGYYDAQPQPRRKA